MNFTKYLWIVLISVVISSPLFAQDIEDYRLATDDEISVTVFNEPDLNIREVRISANGTISMPLLGQVDIASLTVAEVEEKLTNLFLDGYLKKPKLTVTITEYRPFYISGEVRRPGSYPYRKGLTIEKAITIAGGLTERASKSAISLTNEENGRNLEEAKYSDSVRPGDVINISESFF
jgi:polysaccharide export outer membrane protein